MSNEIFDPVLDRPEPTDLYALIANLEQRVRTLEADREADRMNIDTLWAEVGMGS